MERFWSKVRKGDGCWEWQGAKLPAGYGSIRYEGRQHGAHRIAYMLAVGPIPPGMVVMHECDNKGCVRPDHLRLGTALENARDAAAHGLYRSGDTSPSRLHPERLARGDRNGMRTHPESRSYGERQGRSKLTVEKVLLIRELAKSGVRQRELARRFGVSHAAIGAIVHRRSWSYLH